MSLSIKPIGNRVVVELLKTATTSISGIIVATDSKTEQQKGRIVAVGKGYGETADLMDEFKFGQVVIFGKYGGEEILDPSADITYKILDANDVLAIVD
jgi:chaperonin GroES